MYAIQTKYFFAADAEPSHIKAWCAAGSINYPYEEEDGAAHYAAAKALLVSLGWTTTQHDVLVQGVLPNDAGYCHVMVRGNL